MNKSLIFLGLAVALLTVAVGYVYYKIPKVAYVSTNKVYNDYKGKLEYQTKLENEDANNRKILDTLKYEIEMLNAKVSSSNDKILFELESKAKNYERLRTELEERLQTQKQQYIEDIWKQINKHVEEYGAVNGYDYIYGAEGTGALMYADKKDDVTEDVISFINKKYEGK